MAYILLMIVWVYLHSIFCGGLWKTHLFWNRMRIGRSGSSKVVDFGTNRKGVCDFLLVINSNFGPTLHRFWDTASYWLKIANFSYSTLVWRPRSGATRQNFWMKLSAQKLEEWGTAWWKLHDPNFNHFWLIHPCDGRTDRRTDGIVIAYARLAYILSRAISNSETNFIKLFQNKSYLNSDGKLVYKILN